LSSKNIITQQTINIHNDAYCDPIFDWDNRQDFEFSSRGLIHRPNDLAIFDKDWNIVWNHQAFEKFLHGKIPKTVHSSL